MVSQELRSVYSECPTAECYMQSCSKVKHNIPAGKPCLVAQGIPIIFKNAKLNEFVADKGDLGRVMFSVPSDKTACVLLHVSRDLPLKLGNFYCFLLFCI